MIPDGYECRTCHASMTVPDGLDQLEEDVRYCGSCAIAEIERLQSIVSRINPEADGETIDARDCAWNLYRGRVARGEAAKIWPWLEEYEQAEKARQR